MDYTKDDILSLAEGYKKGIVNWRTLEAAVGTLFSSQNSGKPLVSGSLPPTQITKLRNELYDAIPTEGMTEWALLKVIKQHIKRLDELAESIGGNDR